MLASRFWWVSITPLGSPVVPEVNMISARSSGAISTSRGWGSPSINPSSSSKAISGMPRSTSPLGVNRDVKATAASVRDSTRST